MSKQKTGGIMVVGCACGVTMRGTLDVLVPMVIKHARDSHNMNVTREDVLLKARPEA